MTLEAAPGNQESPKFRDLLAEGRAPRFLLICMGIWLYAADSTVTVTIMPSVGRALNGYQWFGWATAGYLLGSVVAGASASLIALRIGLRRATAAAAFAYAIGCALSASAPNIVLFLLGRILQGIGGGWIVGFCMVAVGLIFPNRLLPKVYALTASIWGVATLLGPMVGGLFADHGSEGWRAAFWFFAAQAMITALCALKMLPTERGDKTIGVAWLQLALIAAAVLAIGFADRVTGFLPAMLLLAIAVAALCSAVIIDGRASARLLPTGAADPRTIPGAIFLAVFLLCASTMGFTLYGALILQTVHGFSALVAGYVIAGEALSWSTASLTVSRVTGRARGNLIRVGGLCIVGAVASCILAFPSGSAGVIFFVGCLMGAGFGLSWSFISQRLLMALEKEERARAAAGLATVQSTGYAVGAAGAAAVANLAGLSVVVTPDTVEAAGFWVSVALAPIALLGLAPLWRLSADYPSAPNT